MGVERGAVRRFHEGQRQTGPARQRLAAWEDWMQTEPEFLVAINKQN